MSIVKEVVCHLLLTRLTGDLAILDLKNANEFNRLIEAKEAREREEQINEISGALALVSHVYSIGLINKKTYDAIMKEHSR